MLHDTDDAQKVITNGVSTRSCTSYYRWIFYIKYKDSNEQF